MSSKIPYLKETWQMMGGCSPCSPGCLHCWACRQASGRLKNHPLYEGLTKNGKWTGEIRLCTDIGRADLLEKPLHWKEPRIIGVQFMGDLFLAPFEVIDKVLNVFSLCPRHTGLILTKRASKMLEYFVEYKAWSLRSNSGKPLPNVHLGVSISTQKEADEKIPILLQIPAAHRFVSIEPMLEEIDLISVPAGDVPGFAQSHLSEYLHSIVIGAESKGGNCGRPCDINAVRRLVQQCDAAGVPVHIKQLHIDGKLVKKIEQFPKDLQRQAEI
jgi:protein gp37